MAKPTTISKVDKPKKRKLGRHAKSRTSNKKSALYKKPNVGQGK